MRFFTFLFLSTIISFCAPSAWSAVHIVEEGKPRAQIVIAENPPRTVKLAATELQTYLRKITGAELPIVTQERPEWPVRIYVGQSPSTDKLGIKTGDLKHGAFRMLSGENWLVLAGADKDFIPKEPYGHDPYIEAQKDPKSIEERRRLYKSWDEITRPHGPYLSKPFRETLSRQYSSELRLWHSDMDNAGTFNAVNQFLRDLGVRWYLPGELGEVVPSLSSIELPQIDRTVTPDFANRRFFVFFQEFFTNRKEEILWKFRLGQNVGDIATLGHWSGHGVLGVISREETKQQHPELYKLLPNGKRATEHLGFAGACLSSEGLLAANAQYLRAGFDHYGAPVMTVSPEDGFVSLCACEKCKGKDTPERGATGVFSDYVWDYVSRVAGEIHKTHPDRLIMAWAYGGYTLPPEKIGKLPPNVRVAFAQPGVPDVSDADDRFRKAVEQWEGKTDSSVPFVQWNYLLANWPRGSTTPPGLPDVQTRRIAEYLRFVKGRSQGIYAEVYPSVFSDLNVYVASRFLWNADQDLDALLDEYYTLFYGPAHREMKAFFEFCETNWESMQNFKHGPENIEKAFTLLEEAGKNAGGNETVYQKRIGLIASFMEPLKERREKQLETRAKQENDPGIRGLAGKNANVTLDGKLDEPFWQGLPVSKLSGDEETLWFRANYPDHAKTAGTTVRYGWSGDTLYIGIRCAEPQMDQLQPGTQQHGDASIFEQGQSVEVFLKTQQDSHYQIAVNPEGALMTIQWKDNGMDRGWNSGVEAAAHKGKDFWSVELKIPVTGGDGIAAGGVAGDRPTEEAPWWINVGRTRRVAGEAVNFSLIGSGPFKNPDEYKKFFIGEK